MMARHKAEHQHYALDEREQIVNINNVDKKKAYYCLSCKQLMTPKRGEKNQWHFAHHIGNHKSCSYDKYLHTLAEAKIEEWFNSSEHIWIRLKTFAKCPDYAKCPIRTQTPYSDECCKHEVESDPIDLKRYCKTTCTKEKTYEHNGVKFVADLMTEIRDEDPLFFEIQVTHECTKDKKESGIRIIEIPISSEVDIEAITSLGILIEEQNARFYNFRPKDKLDSGHFLSMWKFIIFKSGKSYLEKDKYNCKNFRERKGVFEITFVSVYDDCLPPPFCLDGGAYAVCWAKAAECGVTFRNCVLCRYHHYNDREEIRICALYKRFGTNRDCQQNDANQCPYYQEKSELKNSCLDALEKYQCDNYVDLWQVDNELQADK